MRSSDFRLLLQDEFEARCLKNKSYSLRSFARSLGMQSSALSEILRGKRKISRHYIKKIGEKINLPPRMLNKFLNQYDRENDPNAPKRRVEDIELNHFMYRQANIDDYHYMSDDLHEMILCSIKFKDFDGTSRWIAKKIGVDPLQIEICVERLQRLKYLEIGQDGKWRDVRGKTLLRPGSHPMIKKAYRKWLKKKLRMLISDVDAPDRKTRHLTHMFALSSEDFKEVQELMVKLSNKIDQRIEQADEDPEQIYQYHFIMGPYKSVNNID